MFDMASESTSSRPLKVHIETWGCQMNVADSERMLGILKLHNYSATDHPHEADLIILNTCHIREKARHKVLSRLGTLKEIKNQKEGMIIAVTGCIPQMEAAALVRSSSVIDIAMGPGQLNDLPQLIADFKKNQKPIIATSFDEPKERSSAASPPYESLVPVEVLSGKNPISRYVNIIQGCENYCTYCVVPYTRGSERSRPVPEIEHEIEHFLAAGAKEITLLGQNVNNYGLTQGELTQDPCQVTPFVTLLERLLENQRIASLRFTTSNPYNFTKPLADLFARHDKLGRYIHLPMQSGSNAILQRMRRKITTEAYLEKISWLKQIDPNFAISSDFIVGFPGETEADFAETLKLVEAIKYSFIFAFKYSPRPGTPAAKFKDQIPEEVKERRLAELLKLQDAIITERYQELIGQRIRVLMHYPNNKEADSYYGRSDYFHLTKVNSKHDLLGKMVEVKVVSANKTAIEGQLLE
jgi:tRNA-2-methylthio-N6-dimethylallyladenosine synthase